MGAGPSAGGGSNRYEPPKKKNPIVEFIKGGGVVGKVIKSVSGAIKTAKKKSKQDLMDYEGQAAGVTKMKSPNRFTPESGGGGNNNNNYASVPVIIKKNIGGTEVQTTQAKVEEASKTNELTANQTKIRNAKKGRTMMQLSGPQGVGKTSSNYSLGKTSLLGRV